MSRTIILALGLMALTGCVLAQQPEGVVVDGVAAVVDGQLILRSEVADAAWFARFSGGGDAGAALTSAEEQDARQHLVDQQLILQTRGEQDPSAPAAEVEAQWARLAQLAGGAAALTQRLAAYHLDAARTRGLLARQIEVLAALDQHFSGDAPASDAQIEEYYHHIFAPAAQAAHLAPMPLEAARARIAAILRQQQLDRAEQQWLAELRAGAQIDIPRAAAKAASGSPNGPPGGPQ